MGPSSVDMTLRFPGFLVRRRMIRVGGTAEPVIIKQSVRRLVWRLGGKRVVPQIRERYLDWRTKVYIVSHPKAGRTWLRVMLGKAISEMYNLPEDVLLDTYAITRRAALLPTRLTHDGASIVAGKTSGELSISKRAYRNKKVILLVRNVKDILVSNYFQATKRRRRYTGTISDFIRDERYGARKVVTFYNGWLMECHVPRDFLLLRYEDMHEDPHRVLAEALEFVGMTEVDEHVLRNAVEYSAFSRMKEMEKSSRWDSDAMRPRSDVDAESFKVRRGIVGGHRDYLSEEDEKYVDQVIEELGWAFGREKDL